MDRAGHSSHLVQKVNGNVINRDKFKPTWLFVGVISRAFTVTFWANTSTPFPGNDGHVDSWQAMGVLKHDFFENEGLVIGDKIEYLLYFDCLLLFSISKYFVIKELRDLYYFFHKLRNSCHGTTILLQDDRETGRVSRVA